MALSPGLTESWPVYVLNPGMFWGTGGDLYSASARSAARFSTISCREKISDGEKSF